MNTLSLAPKLDLSEMEKLFNTHLQDVLLVSYLANTIRAQIDLSNKLAASTAIIPVGGTGGEREGGRGDRPQKSDNKRHNNRDRDRERE